MPPSLHGGLQHSHRHQPNNGNGSPHHFHDPRPKPRPRPRPPIPDLSTTATIRKSLPKCAAWRFVCAHGSHPPSAPNRDIVKSYDEAGRTNFGKLTFLCVHSADEHRIELRRGPTGNARNTAYGIWNRCCRRRLCASKPLQARAWLYRRNMKGFATGTTMLLPIVFLFRPCQEYQTTRLCCPPSSIRP